MVSEQAEALWQAFRDGPKMIDLPLDERRAAGEHAEDATSDAPGVRYDDLDAGILATPPDATPDASVLYLFGGGYVLGSPASRRKTVGHLALTSGCAVLAARYRLAPEHPYPAALDDALSAFRGLVAGGSRADRIVIAGDSAGGGLALATVVALRDAGESLPGGYLGISPWTDLTCSGVTMTEHATVDVECSQSSLLEMASQYLAGHDPRDPLVSPVFADFTGLPPMYVVVGGDEVLLDDTLRIAKAQTSAGGNATVDLVGGCQHVFPIWAGLLPEANAAIRRMGTWINATTSASAENTPT